MVWFTTPRNLAVISLVVYGFEKANTMGKKLGVKTRVEKAKAVAKHFIVTKADGSQRVLCTCSNFTAPSCGSCKQRPYDFDKDLLPKQVVVAWKTYNPCRVCSGERASGSECYGCWATRRKRKDKNQQAVIDQLDAGGDDTDAITSQRRGFVSGDLRYMQLPTGGSSSKSVNENTGIRREEVVEAFFYKIADWLRVMKVSADVMATLQSKRSMVAYARKELNAVVVLDDRGEPGVEESQLPQGASHKVRRLNFQQKEIGDHTAYDDEDEDLAHEQYAGMRLVDVDRAVADEDDDFAGTAPALPSSANRAVASVALGKKSLDDNSHSAEWTSTAPLTLALSSDQSSATPLSRTKVPACLEIASFAQEVYASALTKLNIKTLWSLVIRSRDVERMCDEIQELPSQLAALGTHGPELDLAEEMERFREIVELAQALFTAIRTKPLTLVGGPAVYSPLPPKAKDVFAELDNSSTVQLYTQVGLAIVHEWAYGTGAAARATELIEFMRFDLTPVKLGLSFLKLYRGLEPVLQLQENILLTWAEKLFKTSVDECSKFLVGMFDLEVLQEFTEGDHFFVNFDAERCHRKQDSPD